MPQDEVKKRPLLNAIDIGSTLAGGTAGWFAPDLIWDKPTYVQRGSMAGIMGLLALAGSKLTQDALNKGRKHTTVGDLSSMGEGFAKGTVQSLPGGTTSQQLDPNKSANTGYHIARDLNPFSSTTSGVLFGTGTVAGAVGSHKLTGYLNRNHSEWRKWFRDNYQGNLPPAKTKGQKILRAIFKDYKDLPRRNMRPAGWRTAAGHVGKGALLTQIILALGKSLQDTPYSGTQE